MKTALKIAIYSYIHHKGWCAKYHRTPKQLELLRSQGKNFKGICPLVDVIMFLLYPMKFK